MEEIKKEIKAMSNVELLIHYNAFVVCEKTTDECEGCPYNTSSCICEYFTDLDLINEHNPRLLEDEILKRMKG